MLRIEAAGVTASIAPELGGRLASLVVGGQELLVTAPTPADASIRWGCFLMAPWPGRLAGGRFSWQGRTIQLPLTHGRNAIHGLLWGRPWRVDAAERASATLSCELPLDEWPMGGVVRQSFTLTPESLTQHATIEAGDAMPAALGWHPWFLRRGDVALTVRADHTLETRGMLPTGRTTRVAGRSDLRVGPTLGRRRLDDAYVGTRPPIEIAWTDMTLRLDTQPWLSTVVVFTPSGSFCVEPQTAWPDGFNRPATERRAAGVTDLEPGESLQATLRLVWG